MVVLIVGVVEVVRWGWWYFVDKNGDHGVDNAIWWRQE